MGKTPGENERGKNDAIDTTETGGLFAGIRKVAKWVKSAVMKAINPYWKPSDSTSEPTAVKHAPLALDLSLKLESQTKKILDDIGALLKSDAIKEEKEKQIVRDAAGFLENPTESLDDISKHTKHVGHVCGGYDQQGEDIPPALDAMHAHLMALLCANRMSFVENELKKGLRDTPEIKHAMKMADDRATHLSRGYKDDTILTAVNELQKRLE